MRRYVVGTLLLSIVMFVQLFGNIPVFADTFVPTSSYDFTALADLGYALVGGAEFDFDGTPYVIDNYNSLSSEQKEIQKSLAARQFLMDYMESRGIAFEEDGELHKGSTYYTIAFGLAGQEFFEAFQTASASEQEDLEYNMPISPSRFADWAQYNKYWFNRYADSFSSDSDQPSYNVPAEYQTYVEIINGQGFQNWLNQVTNSNALSTGVTPLIWDNSLTYWYYGSQYMSNINYQAASLIWNNVCCSDIYTLNIYSNNGTYSYSITSQSIGSLKNNFVIYNRNNVYYNQGHPYYLNDVFQTYYANSTSSLAVPDWNQSFNSLENLFKHLSACVHNINIYVDGQPWSLVSNPAPANPAVPDFPDIINQENGELAYDITMPKTSDYSGSFDLTSLFDAIREGIAGASDGDLATGSTIGSLDVGRTYTGEGIDIQDRVIDLTSSRVFDGTLTDDTTGRLPKPPVVPPAVSAGLGGVTVLAKYVDATQCILPEDLMTAFWGCVWILIMLGLIKNLHR